MPKKPRTKSSQRLTWDQLPDSWKEFYTREDWEAGFAEVEAWEEKRKAQMKRPADWVEPSITIEQAQADPFYETLADMMRRHDIKVLTRSQYFAIEYGNAVPRPWTAELESTLPTELQDRYMTVPKRLGRVNLDPRDL